MTKPPPVQDGSFAAPEFNVDRFLSRHADLAALRTSLVATSAAVDAALRRKVAERYTDIVQAKRAYGSLFDDLDRIQTSLTTFRDELAEFPSIDAGDTANNAPLDELSPRSDKPASESRSRIVVECRALIDEGQLATAVDRIVTHRQSGVNDPDLNVECERLADLLSRQLQARTTNDDDRDRIYALLVHLGLERVAMDSFLEFHSWSLDGIRRSIDHDVGEAAKALTNAISEALVCFRKRFPRRSPSFLKWAVTEVNAFGQALEASRLGQRGSLDEIASAISQVVVRFPCLRQLGANLGPVLEPSLEDLVGLGLHRRLQVEKATLQAVIDSDRFEVPPSDKSFITQVDKRMTSLWHSVMLVPVFDTFRPRFVQEVSGLIRELSSMVASRIVNDSGLSDIQVLNAIADLNTLRHLVFDDADKVGRVINDECREGVRCDVRDVVTWCTLGLPRRWVDSLAPTWPVAGGPLVPSKDVLALIDAMMQFKTYIVDRRWMKAPLARRTIRLAFCEVVRIMSSADKLGNRSLDEPGFHRACLDVELLRSVRPAFVDEPDACVQQVERLLDRTIARCRGNHDDLPDALRDRIRSTVEDLAERWALDPVPAA
ncbi:unnamed protein product (mitochondrion) [Plasmodiophora brassicae]|uniref:Exocyst component Exo84 C-terminal domain-containing protein n=1 Tax=Plasmodiophora brassicae TaxID=37360 RepID=A0A0G4IRW4_PLABS|nr:hypothetical protein PBRA_006013 [Plasmodiophora brassicae]SPQ98116.1 unnamed protein product [Plasmodiophora brassicae]